MIARTTPHPGRRHRVGADPARRSAILALAMAAMLSAPVALAEPREMATDRPDVTESPVPVEAGRWQLEMDAIAWTHHGSVDTGGRTIEGAVLNLKRGLDARTDVQFLLAPLTIEKPAGASAYDAPSPWAFGLRLKRNLWGLEGGSTTAALLPWVEWDAGESDAARAWSAGLAVPLGLELGAGFGAGLMLEGASVHGGAGERGSQWTASATIGHTLQGPLAAYIEWVGSAAGEALETPSTLLSLGLTLKPTADLQFDAGVRLGQLRSDDDTMFVGLAVRR